MWVDWMTGFVAQWIGCDARIGARVAVAHSSDAFFEWKVFRFELATGAVAAVLKNLAPLSVDEAI